SASSSRRIVALRDASLADCSSGLTSTVTDSASNISPASAALLVTVDATAPLLASATVNANTVVLTYTEAGVGMAGLTPAAGDFRSEERRVGKEWGCEGARDRWKQK